jgi:hypothetical protein
MGITQNTKMSVFGDTEEAFEGFPPMASPRAREAQATAKGPPLFDPNKRWDTYTLTSIHTIERRKYPRVKIDTIVTIACAGSSNVAGHAVDLSLTGVCFVCPALEVEIGEVLKVTLDVRGTTVRTTGKVVRITNLNAFAQELALAFC